MSHYDISSGVCKSAAPASTTKRKVAGKSLAPPPKSIHSWHRCVSKSRDFMSRVPAKSDKKPGMNTEQQGCEHLDSPDSLYRRTGNYSTLRILNHHYLNCYFELGRSHQINKHHRPYVLRTESQLFFQIFVCTKVGSSRALRAPVDTRLFTRGDAIISGPTVLLTHTV